MNDLDEPQNMSTMAITTMAFNINDISDGVGVGEMPMGEGWVSDFMRYLFEVIVFTFLCGTVSMIGIVTNIINIVVFVRQGILSDSSNVSLLGLAVSDLLSLVGLLWLSICMAILFKEPPNLSWEPHGVSFVTAGIPHVISAQITCWITAFIAFERCMCVVFPFKMRSIFTAKRSAVIIPLIFIYNVACFVPVFATHRLKWEIVSNTTNRTRLVLHFTENFETAQKISNYTNSFFNRLFTIAVVIVCTRITSYKVNFSKNFRKSMAAVSESSHVSSVRKGGDPAFDGNQKSKHSTSSSQKEVRLVRMINTICIIFLVCYCPDMFMAFFRGAIPGIKHKGRYHNLFHVFYSIGFFLESVNSTLNIIVYYKMSTRYRHEFRRWFGMSEKPNSLSNSDANSKVDKA